MKKNRILFCPILPHPSSLIPDYSSASDAVVQELPVAVCQCPQEARAREEGARQRNKIAYPRALPANGRAVPGDEAQAPGLHREGAAAALPLPRKVNSYQRNEVELEQQPPDGVIETVREHDEGERAGKQYGGE